MRGAGRAGRLEREEVIDHHRGARGDGPDLFEERVALPRVRASRGEGGEVHDLSERSAYVVRDEGCRQAVRPLIVPFRHPALRLTGMGRKPKRPGAKGPVTVPWQSP